MHVTDNVDSDHDTAHQHRQMKNPNTDKDYPLWSPFKRFTKEKAFGLNCLERVKISRRTDGSAALMTKRLESSILRQTRDACDLLIGIICQ